MNQSDTIKEIAPAIVKAQGDIKSAPKTATNPHFKSKYADLAAIIDVSRKPLADNGLATLVNVSWADGLVIITTRLLHLSGEWIESDPLPIPVSQLTAQGIGSAITYGRRYSLAALLNIASEDNDGNGHTQQSQEGSAETDKEKLLRSIQPMRKAISDEAYYQMLGELGYTSAKEMSIEEIKTKLIPALAQRAKDKAAEEKCEKNGAAKGAESGVRSPESTTPSAASPETTSGAGDQPPATSHQITLPPDPGDSATVEKAREWLTRILIITLPSMGSRIEAVKEATGGKAEFPDKMYSARAILALGRKLMTSWQERQIEQ